MKLLKRTFIIFLLFSIVFISCKTQKDEDEKLPNIIYILADDMGYGDILALNRNSRIPTPNLDEMVENGISFSDAHTNSAVCTPTRYGILTGRYCFRSRLKSGVLVGHESSLIEPGRMTVASLLKQAGYNTGCVGKWHLGLDWAKKDESKPLWEGGNVWDIKNTGNVDYSAEVNGGPRDHGFDYSYIIPASLDIAPYIYIENRMVTAPVSAHCDEWRGKEARGMWYRHGDIADDFKHAQTLQQITKKAVDYINNVASDTKPFFLYFPMTAPHTPWLPSEEFKGKSGAGVYGDFVMMVDHMVGEVLKAVEAKGELDNTIVVFTSDNGSHWFGSDIEAFGHEANSGRIGMKSDAWDGGHRVPFVVQWPAKIKGGATSNEIICTTDLLATCAELTGLSIPANAAEDSYSILSAMIGEKIEKPIREATIHHSINGTFAIRKGNWKLIEAKGSGGWSLSEKEVADGAPEGQLFDMVSDPKEQVNLYNKKPEVVNELKALLEKYKKQGFSRPM
jgi:arylsulfatase A-like enzyme